MGYHSSTLQIPLRDSEDWLCGRRGSFGYETSFQSGHIPKTTKEANLALLEASHSLYDLWSLCYQCLTLDDAEWMVEGSSGLGGGSRHSG